MNNQHEAFVDHLYGMAERKDLQALAVLRRSLGSPPGNDFAIYPYIGTFLNEKNEHRLRTFCLVAGLFAASKPAGVNFPGEESLGRSLANLCSRNERARNGIERRLTALLNAHGDDLPEHLRHLIVRLATEGQTIDWRSLARDLLAWESEGRWVQRRWAKDFWGRLPQKEQGEEE